MNTHLIWNLIKYNKKDSLHKPNITHKGYQSIIKIQDDIFQISSIATIINSLTFLKEQKSYNNVKILINSKSIADDATVVLFEALIYELVKDLGVVKVAFAKLRLEDRNSHLLIYSLLYSQKPIKRENISQIQLNKELVITDSYIKQFEKGYFSNSPFMISGCVTKNSDMASIYTSIYMVLNQFTYSNNKEVENELVCSITEVVNELIGNAIEHAGSECIYSIKTQNLINLETKDKDYHQISVTILNFSNFLLGSKLCSIIEEDNHEINPNNEIIFKAFNNHKNMFSANYDFESFGLLSAFQQKVSSRAERGKSAISGSGLSTCLSNLKKYGKGNYCYLLSGHDYLIFKDDCWVYNDEGLIGFNEHNNFLTEKPDSNYLKKHDLNICGTLYSLTFLVKENDND